MSEPLVRRADPFIAVVLFVTVLASYACFTQSTDSPNLRTHMFLALSLAESGSLRIDPYRPYTLDRATVDGHTYSEKAPGLALTAVPVVAAARLLQRRAAPDESLLSDPPELTPAFRSLTRVTTLATVGVLGALGVVAVYAAGLRLGAGPAGAAFGAWVLAWATPFWGWSTAMFGHVPAATLLVAALLLILLARDGARAPTGLVFGAGACLGWAIVIEFPAAGAAGLIAAYGVWSLRRPGAVVALGAGIVIALLPLAIYNERAFGSPLRLGYGETEPWYPAMKSGLFGLQWPRPAVLGELIAGERRGLLWFAPAGLLGFLCLPWISRSSRADAAVLAGVPLYYLLLISGYAYWDGGWSTGPRHLTAALPFLCLALALAWRASRRRGRIVLAAGAVAGAAVAFLCVSTSMFAPDTLTRPWTDFLIPAFAARWESRWPPVWGAWATVAPWELGLGHRAGLLAAAAVPLAATAAIALRLGRGPQARGRP